MRRHSPRTVRPIAAGVLCVALAAAVASCGGDAQHPTSPPSAGPRGATVAVPKLPATLDPALATTLAERAIAQATQTPLLTYKRSSGDDAATLEPGLAGDLPTLSADDHEYRFQLRRGLVYADGGLVKASDVERAIAHASVVSADPVMRATLTSIIGAPSRDGQTLSGVRSDDRTGVVVIRLRHADGRIPFALADPATAPLPSLPRPGRAPASTGPLRIASHTGKSIELAANPLRPTISTVPAAKLAQVSVVPERGKFPGVLAADLRSGKIDVDLGRDSPSDGFKSGGAARISGPTTSMVDIYMKTSGTTASRALRRAIAGAIDGRNATSKFGDYVPSCTLIPGYAAGTVSRDPCPAPPTDADHKPLANRPPMRVSIPETLWGAGAMQLINDAIERLGGTWVSADSRDPVAELARGKADIAIDRAGTPLPHPSFWLGDAARFDALLAREVPKLTRGPLTGTGGQWAALEKRAVDRAIAIPLLAIQRPVLVGAQIDRRSVLIHPVIGLDLAALDVN